MRASYSCTLAALMGFLVTTKAFLVSNSATAVRCRSLRRHETQQVAAEEDKIGTSKAWDGKGWPEESEKRKGVPSDTKSWEMAQAHVEVWEDLPNPVEQLGGPWWENYAPSQEEMDAAAKGFNWTTEWFEAADINPEEPTSADKPSEE